MTAKSPTLNERYLNLLRSGLSGAEDFRRSSLLHAIRWLKSEYQNKYSLEPLLTKPEAVALAKKLLSRALDAEFTKSEVEAFLGK